MCDSVISSLGIEQQQQEKKKQKMFSMQKCVAKNTPLKRYLHPSSVPYNGEDVGTTWVPVDGWMGKVVVCVCVRLSHEEWGNPTICNNVSRI